MWEFFNLIPTPITNLYRKVHVLHPNGGVLPPGQDWLLPLWVGKVSPPEGLIPDRLFNQSKVSKTS